MAPLISSAADTFYVGTTEASKIYLGSTEVWASGPTDPYWDNVILLLNGDGTQGSTTFTDLSNENNTTSVTGSLSVDTSTVKFGTGSIDSTASGGRINITPTATWNITYSTPLTFEFWTYLPSITTNQYAFEIRDASASQQMRVQFIPTNRVDLIIKGGQKTTLNNTVPVNQWVHFATTWDGSLARIFINGTQIETFTRTDSGAFSASTIAVAGKNGTNTNLLGYMDDVRFTLGVARYTGNFTIPTEAFPIG